MPSLRETLPASVVAELNSMQEEALASEADPWKIAVKEASGDIEFAKVLFDVRRASQRATVKHPARSPRVAAQMETKRPI